MSQSDKISNDELNKNANADPCEIESVDQILGKAESEQTAVANLDGTLDDQSLALDGAEEQASQIRGEEYKQIEEASGENVEEPSADELVSISEEVIELAQVEPAAGEEDQEGSIAELTSGEAQVQAQELAKIEPEAGGQTRPQGAASSGRGYGFQSDFEAQGVISLNDVGPIDPTALQYGIEFNRDEFFLQNDAGGALPPLNPVFELGDHRVSEDGSVRLFAFASPESGNGALTITISGIPSGWDVTDQAFDAFDNPIGTGVFDETAGTWTITLPVGESFEGGPVFSPPADSDVDALNLVFDLDESDATTGQSGAASGEFDIIVDAVADAPEIDAEDDSGDEGVPLDVDISALTGEEVNNGAGSDDGSESIVSYEISGVPDGFVLSAGTETAPGSGVYVLTPAELAGLTVTPSDPNYSGSITLTATVFTTENPVSDGEFDLTNNNNQASDEFTLTWAPVADIPRLVVDDALVKEDSSVFVPVEAELTDTDGSEFLTITVEGIPSSWGFSGTGWVQTGPESYEITLPAGDNYDGGFTLTPPADSDVDLTGISVTATSTEIANGDSASVTEDIGVIVDAVYDDPTVDGLDNSGAENTPLDVDVSGAAGDTDGSETVVRYEISDVPTGFVFNQGSDLGGGVWSFTPAELAGLQITPPADFVGDIDLTVTIFTTENPDDGEVDTSDNTASESDMFTLTWRPEANPPTVNVNNGVDDALVLEDNSVEVPIVANLDPVGSGNEILTVTVTGIDPSWGFSAPVGTYTPATGTWTVTLPAGENLSTVFTFTPPADSDIDLTGLQATASAYEPATDTTANAVPDDFNIIVDAVADAPEIDAEDDSGDEGVPLDVDISALTGEEVNNGAGSDDGSESIVSYEISGVPDGFVLSAGTETAPGSGVYVLTPAELAGLTVTPSDPNYSGSITLTATVFTTENPVSDGEFDLTNNNNQASDVFTLTWAPVINPPTIKVNNGVDDAIVKEDGNIDVPIVAQLGANPAAGEFLTVTVTGIDPAWGSFSAPVGTYTPATGTWTVTLPAGEALDTVFTFAPNADADIDLTGLVATVVATDPDAMISADADDSFNVITDAVADVPNLDSGSATGEEGTTIPLSVTTSVNDVDGSEVIEVIRISNLPAGTSLTAGTYNAVDDVWELSPADLVGLGLVVPDGVTGNFSLNVESVAYEQNTNGTEVDLTDNRASAFDVIEVSVKKDDTPKVKNDKVSVDETDLSPTTFVDGNISADFGDDAPGEINGNGTYVINGLTSGGVPVDVEFNDVTNTYTGTAGGNPIFTLVIASNGDYTFTLQGVVDHPDTSDHNDVLPIQFGVTATDSDGDSTDATITVNVFDDGPSIDAQYSYVGEHKLENGPIVISKPLTFDYGQDGAGSVEPNGMFTTKYEPGGANQVLTSGGEVVDVTPTADGYVGVVGSETVFTITIDSVSGAYTYTQFLPVDHPEGSIADDVLWIQFGITVTDADGDTVDTIIGMDIYDDAPDAEDDCIEVSADDGVVTGNVVDNDDLSQDVANLVTQVSFGTDVFDLPVNGDDIVINGQFGVLTINNTGEYSYDLFDDVFSGGGVGAGGSDSLDPVKADADGVQDSISQNGITVAVANAGDFDITWLDTHVGSGLGIDNLNTNDSEKVWPKGETFDVDFDRAADTVTVTIAELGSNNNSGKFGADLVLYFDDGSSVVAEQQFVPGEIVDGVFDFTINASDYGDKLITGFDLNSTNDGDYKGASFLLNNVAVTYPGHDPECVEDQFEYVLADGDLDTDSALLKIKTFAPEAELIVGKNVDDVEGSDEPHLVNGDRGVIDGEAGADILVGDAGGSMLVPQVQNYNFAFVVDVSGSMGSSSSPTSKISLMIDALENLFNEFGAYDGGEIKIHITPFSRDVLPSATFTVTNANELADAIAFVNALDGNDYTNYESPLVEVNEWLQSDDPIADAITTTYFFSDGNPNKYIDEHGNIAFDSTGNVVMEEITGSDGSDEVSLLHSLNDDVIAVGIEATDLIMSRLDVIDLDGDALRIDDAADLTVALADTSPLDQLLPAGGDDIRGGEGDDAIFGDVLFTDDLAELHGLSSDEGAGWEVFERLENGESVLNASWSREDTIEYIRSNAQSLARESVDSQGNAREAGGDVIDGGEGDDAIFAQEGDDVIIGGLGNDVIYGGSGADTFLFETIEDGFDVIADFNAQEGDQLDLSGLLFGYDPLVDDIADFVLATESAGNTTVSVDVTGNGGAGEIHDLALLTGVTGFDVNADVKTDTIV